jgi:hypothetical protein
MLPHSKGSTPLLCALVDLEQAAFQEDPPALARLNSARDISLCIRRSNDKIPARLQTIEARWHGEVEHRELCHLGVAAHSAYGAKQRASRLAQLLGEALYTVGDPSAVWDGDLAQIEVEMHIERLARLQQPDRVIGTLGERRYIGMVAESSR